MYKTCGKCGVEKPHTEFHKKKASKDGLRHCCKACAFKYRKKYCQENKEQVREYGKKWAKNNPHIGRAKNQKRRASKKAALPHLSDNDKLALKLLAEEAALLGPNFHLDHIVPLSKGGLHHHENLQIVRSSYNLSKSNNLWQIRKYT